MSQPARASASRFALAKFYLAARKLPQIVVPCICSLFSIFFTARPACAFEFGTGGGFISQGDDRILPAVAGWLQFNSNILISGAAVGEKNSDFSQQTALLHLSYSSTLENSKSLRANLGVGEFINRTRILKFDSDGNSSSKLSNATGLALGLHWTPALNNHLRFRAAWDALYIPPGISVLYLTFGHLQSVTAGLGWEF